MSLCLQREAKKGNLHPVTQVKDQLSEIFTSMGFEVYEGTEIENDYYNFTALNTPSYLSGPVICRIHSTYHLSSYFVHRPQQDRIHVMEEEAADQGCFTG